MPFEDKAYQSREYSFEDFARRLGVTVERISRIDFGEALRVCSYLIQNDTRERFMKAEDPDGRKWAPLKRKPRIPKGRGVDQPLWATGRLVASTSAGAPDFFEELAPYGLVIGTHLSYAGYHQYGTRHIPARPFMGIGDDLAKQLEDVLVKFAEDEIAEALGG